MSLTVGATVRTPDGEIRTVKEYPYDYGICYGLVLLSDDTAYDRRALEPIASEVAA